LTDAAVLGHHPLLLLAVCWCVLLACCLLLLLLLLFLSLQLPILFELQFSTPVLN